MRLAAPGSSSLNFLAGICAGAGINLITSVSVGPEVHVSIGKIAVDSALWVITAAFITWAAQIVQRGERDADIEMIGDELTAVEKRDIRAEIERKSWRSARLPVALTVISLIGSVMLLPGVIHWSELW
jgi:hypothetical protein